MKKLIILATFILMFVAIVPVIAQTGDLYGINDAGQIGLTQTDETPQTMAIKIVRWVISFLGIVATCVILLGGFKWMTAGGNEDKVGEAKKLLAAGIIGLVIVLAAYAIVSWLVGTTTGLLGGENIN